MKLKDCKDLVYKIAKQYEKMFCKNIQVKYVFKNGKHEFGYAMVTETHYPYEYAIITIYYQKLQDSQVTETLIHEYVHVSNFEVDLMFSILDDKTKDIFMSLVERNVISITKTIMELIKNNESENKEEK